MQNTADTQNNDVPLLKGLKFHTVMLFKDQTSGKVIDALTIDNNFTKDRLQEYKKQYQYGDVTPDALKAPQTLSEWWQQLDVQKYMKDQMEKDYLMSLYLDNVNQQNNDAQQTTLKPDYYTISVNTDKDVTDFLDFLNHLRERLGVSMNGGSPDVLDKKIGELKSDYEAAASADADERMKTLYKKYGNLPVVYEIFGKAAIKELTNNTPADKVNEKRNELNKELETAVKRMTVEAASVSNDIAAILFTPDTYAGLFNT